ncbi:MAG: UDP-N-acetylmuramate-alanine ligase, partial [Candidatus Atelocyanobacterium thalassa isolate SIO64986]
MGKTIDFSGQPFHFIGIGGIGMSALAYILAKRKLPVSGSDLRSTNIIERLQKVGVRIFNHQEAINLEFFNCNQKQVLEEIFTSNYDNKIVQNKKYLPQVICSTAITNDNPEYLAAKEKGCPIFHRSDILAALISDYKSIGIAGTHGKTTTSSLIGYMLLQAGIDPTIIIGGEVDAWDGNARMGAKEGYLVAEVDESDGSLIKHHPHIGVITNIELDHPDYYQDLDEVINTFQIFAA